MTAAWLTPVTAIAVKDLRHLARDRGAFFFTFLFPVGIAIFFGYLFGGPAEGPRRDLEIAVYDADGGPAARAFLAGLTAPGEGLVAAPTGSVEACEARVRARDSLACLVVPRGFEGGIEAMLTGRPATLEIVVDPSRRAEAGLLTGKLMASGFRQLASGFGDAARMAGMLSKARSVLASDPELPTEARSALEQLYGGLDALSKVNSETGSEGQASGGAGGWQPLKIETRELQARRTGPPSSFAVSFPQGVVWGLMSCVMAFASSLVRERTRGTMVRLTAAPIAPAQVLAGKSLACFAACVAVQALILAVAGVGFGVQVGARAQMMAAVLCAGAGFTGLTILLAGVSRSEEGSSGLRQAALMVLALIGGGAVPLAYMPDGMVTASHISPFKWALLAFEGALWRGFGWREMMLPCGILLVVAVLGFLGGTALLRRMRVE